MKKIILGLVAVVVIGALFFAGWYARGMTVDRERDASFEPAISMMEGITSGEGIEDQYKNASELYRSTIDEATFKNSVSPLKDAQITSVQQYTGVTDSFISYELVKADKSYNMSVSTIKKDGKWQVNSVIANELSAQ